MARDGALAPIGLAHPTLVCWVACILATASPTAATASDWKTVARWNCATQPPASEVGSTSVVKSRAGEYREGGARLGDRFVYPFRLSAPNRWVRATVDYPDDNIRTAGISSWGPPQEVLGSGFMCGDDIPLSHRMQRRQYVFFSNLQDAALVFSTEAPGQPVAVASVEIEEIPTLPEVGKAPVIQAKEHRRVGLAWEDPILSRCFGVRDSISCDDFELALQRCSEYMKWSGLNEISYPVYWYTGPIFDSQTTLNYPIATRQHPPDAPIRLARRFEQNDIAFSPALNIFKIRRLKEHSLSEDQVIAGSVSSINTVSAEGRIVTWDNAQFWRDCVVEPLNPIVQGEIRSLFLEVANQCAPYACFKGIDLELWPGTISKLGSSAPGDAPISFDDYAVESFCAEANLVPPGARGDKQRFSQRASWLQQDEERWNRWLKWRAAEMTRFYCSLAESLAAVKPGAKLGLNIYMGHGRPENEGTDINRQIFASGVDLDALSKHPSICIKRYAHQMLPRWRLRNGMPRPMDLNIENSPDFQRPFAKRPGMGFIVHQQYFETRADVNGERLSLPPPFQDEPTATAPNATMRVTEPLPTGRDYLRFFAHAIRNYDPMSMTVGGYVLGTQGVEPELRAMARAFSALPAVNFADVVVSDSLVVRSAEAEGRTWIYAVNLASVDQSIALSIDSGALGDCLSGDQFSGHTAHVTLQAYEVRAFYAPLHAKATLVQPTDRQ